MKTSIIFFAAILYFTPIALAQQVTIGPKVGLNIAGWSTTFDNIGSRFAYHIGGFGAYALTDQIGLQAELSFNAIGAKNQSNSNPGRIATNYISIPLLGTYNFTDEISIHAGFQPSFLLAAKSIVTSGSNEGKYESKELFNGGDLSFLFGGTYRINEKVQVGLRVALGLSDIHKDNEDTTKNTVFQIYAEFPLVTLD